MTVQCCVCKKVKVNESWMTTAGNRLREVSHTYCPVCLGATKVAMENEGFKITKVQAASA